jgi:hypothetical protein
MNIPNDPMQRFEGAFSNPESVKAEEYQNVIADNAAKASENIERLTLRLLGLATLLILVALGEIEDVALGIGKIPNQFILMSALLILISYTHYDLVFNLSKFDQLSVIYKIIIKHRHGPIHEGRLSKYFLFPPALYEYRLFSTEGLFQQIQSYIWLAEFLTIMILIPFGTEIIGFSKLFALQNTEYPVLLKASLFITTLFNLQSVFIIYTLLKGAKDK